MFFQLPANRSRIKLIVKGHIIRASIRTIVFCAVLIGLALVVRGQSQADEICQEFGETPTREVGRDNRLGSYARRGRLTGNYL